MNVALQHAATDPSPHASRHRRRWTVLAAAEVAAATAVIVADRGVPTIALLALATVSLLVRREHVGSLGFRRPADRWFAAKMLAFAAGWSVFQLAVTMPIANHLSGRQQDLSDFADIEGNVGLLVAFLALSWTLAALGEEIAYRGYLQTRLRQLFGRGIAGLIGAIVVSSVLFGLVHSEQGLVGVVVVTIDAIGWSVIRYRYRTLWASVLVHGFNNTIGFVAFFFVGPVHGFW